mgnify:CR=1 FL=1
MRDGLPQPVNTPELRFDCADERKFDVVEEVKARLQEAGAKFIRHRRRARQHRRTAGGCCAPPTPSPCWWRAARRADEAGLERLMADLKAALAASGVSLPDEAPAGHH